MTPMAGNPLPQPPSSGSGQGGLAREPFRDRQRAAPGPADRYLDHLRELAAMIALLERLPDLTGDIGDWRGFAKAAPAAEPVQGGGDAILHGYRELDPVIRRAFDAVVAGLDKLAGSAVDLCGRRHDPPTRDEIEACAEIGASMRPLLERALALAESVRPRDAEAATPERAVPADH
jgi:hypothetical protein